MSKKKPAKRKSKVKVDPKRVAHYMSLNYPIVLTRMEDNKGWYAEIPLVQGCLGDGKTPDEAVADVRDVLQGWIQIMLEDGDPIAEPEMETA